MKNVIVTIDTEGHAGADPIKHLIMGQTQSGELYGIPKIMDICDEFGVKALFFVDFAAAWDYGKERISEVVHYILNRGHDVGVHIHPDHMVDKNRLFLYEYSRDEQREIIEKCTALYTEIVGKAPVAFRAGKYGANYDTLDILKEFGYQADFSSFYRQKWCGLNPAPTINETIQLENGLLEVPVTVYGNYFPGIFNRVDKLDINSSMAEHSWVLSQLANQDEVNTICLFLHSFSFLKWRQDVNNPQKDERFVKSFRRAMEIVNSSEKMQFCTVEDIVKSEFKQFSQNSKLLYSFSGARALYFFFLKAIQVLGYRYYSMRYGETL